VDDCKPLVAGPRGEMSVEEVALGYLRVANEVVPGAYSPPGLRFGFRVQGALPVGRQRGGAGQILPAMS